jgi:hypothetical protein
MVALVAGRYGNTELDNEDAAKAAALVGQPKTVNREITARESRTKSTEAPYRNFTHALNRDLLNGPKPKALTAEEFAAFMQRRAETQKADPITKLTAPPKLCANAKCREPLQAERSTKKYCSDGCKQQAFRDARVTLTPSGVSPDRPVAGRLAA